LISFETERFIRNGASMLLEIAIGDAYGAGFEFSAREKIVHGNTLARYLPHDLGIEAGHYTDDTQMSIAVSETLLGASELTSDAFADAFVRCFKRDPRGNTFLIGLDEALAERYPVLRLSSHRIR
jgi:ADP-ribosylglycohydrolase